MSIWRWFKRATPPPPQHAEWPPAWRPARWQLCFDDAAVLGLARAYAEQLPGVARLESLDDPEAVLR